MTTAIIDGDIVAFRACSVLGEDPFDPTGPKVPLPEHVAIHTAKLLVTNWMEAAGCDKAIVCLTGEVNFRKALLPSYKAARGPKPDTLAATKAALLDLPGGRLVEGLEADDLMGILLTNGRHPHAVGVTVDKDLRTVPGLHYNPVKGEWHTATPRSADTAWFMQTLMGDRVDGYTGIPGVGPAKAEKLLGKNPAWSSVVFAYLSAGMTADDALTMARVARILRAEDYDRSNKEILLWHPETPTRLRLDELSGNIPSMSSGPPPSKT